MNPLVSHSFFPIIRAANSLVLMTIAMVGMYAAIMVLEPATHEFNVGRGAGALPYTLFMVGFGLGSVILGRMVDRYGIAWLAITGAVCLPLGLYISSIVQQYWAFIITLSVLCGLLGSAFSFGPLVTDISHWFDNRRGLAVGIVISGSYLSGAIWPPILQGWIDTVGWREAFFNLSIICAFTMLPLSLIYFVKKPDEQRTESDRPPHVWDQPLGMSTARLQCALCFAGIGCCVAMSMPQVHIVPYVIDLGFQAKQGAYMLSLMLGFGIVSRIFSGWISDRIGGLKTLLLGSGFQALVIMLFLVVDTLSGLYLVSIAFGLSQGGIVPSYTIIIRRFFRPGEAGQRIGLVFVATIGGMALGGWIAGALYDLTGTYTLSFLNAIALNIINLAIAGFLLRRKNAIHLEIT